jgi:cytoskeleton protein RodZ
MASERRRKLDRLRNSDKRRLNLQEVGEEVISEGAAYQGIGETLRAARLGAGLDLRIVATQLRIRYAHLLAMEEGRFEELPGRIYAIGFLRTYAEHLRLDPDAVIEAFKEETSALHTPGRLVFPIPAPETRTPRSWLIVLCLLVAAAVYGGWYYNHERTRMIVQSPPPPIPAQERATANPGEKPPAPTPSENQQPPSAATPATTSPNPPEAAIAKSPASDAAFAAPPAPLPTNPSPSPTVAAPVPANPPPPAPMVAAVQSSPPAAPAEPPKPIAAEPPKPAAAAAAGADATATQTYGSAERTVRVVLRARSDSWIDVRGANNEVLLPGRVLHEGDVYRVPNRADAVLWTGNLGGLEVVVDGNLLPRLGQVGEARRNISLDPKNLLAAATR